MDELAGAIARDIPAGSGANWTTGKPDDIPAVGGAMDLAIGAKDVYVMMALFTRSGEPKLVPQCTYPLTGVGCVSRVYTDCGIFDVGPSGVRIRQTYGVSAHELTEQLGIRRLGLSVESCYSEGQEPGKIGTTRSRPARPVRRRRSSG
ncbi:3-oxoacid CoA-transferase B subunit [Streptacidiphilus sp. EB103A]